MLKFKIYWVLLLLAVITSCSNKQSLQEYYVDSKENNQFVMIDIPTSLISPESQNLTVEQKEVLNSVKKINLLAYPLKNGTPEEYTTETVKIKSILKTDSYDELMSFGEPGKRMKLYLKGEEEAIDELIVFAEDEQKGFMLARVLGNKMNVSEMINLIESMEKNGNKLDVSQFEDVMDIFQ